MAAPVLAPATSRNDLTALVGKLSQSIVARPDPAANADLVAAVLRAGPPSLNMLTAAQRQGDPRRLMSWVLHAESAFSVVALVWRPGQETTIHDHLAWCVVAVLCGTEQETLYRDDGDHLTPIARSVNATGSVTAIAPPGDIHRVSNDTDTTAISLHVYGADLSVTGSSIRRTYHLPVVGSRRTAPRY